MPIRRSCGSAESKNQRTTGCATCHPAQPSAETMPRALRFSEQVGDAHELRRLAALDGEQRCHENVAIKRRRELLDSSFPAFRTGEAQAVEMRLDPQIEAQEIGEPELRRANRTRAALPQRRRLLGVLADDGRDCCRR